MTPNLPTWTCRCGFTVRAELEPIRHAPAEGKLHFWSGEKELEL